MQDQIANTVGFRICAPPDLIVVELFETAFDFRKVFAQQKIHGSADERPRDFIGIRGTQAA
jgi:hypothetical protein